MLLALVLSSAEPALALSDAERAGARAAAAEGVTAFDQKRWSDAIDMFQRAEAIVHSPVHLLYIGKAQIELGHLVEAQEALIKVVNENVSPHAPAAFLKAQQEAERLLAALEPRIAHISVVVQGETRLPVIVKMDGEQVPPTLVGVPRPVNPGEHKFVAISGDRESNQTAVTVREGTKETVVLTLLPPNGSASGRSDAAAAPPEAEADAGGARSLSGLTIAGLAGLGVGVVGLGLGTAFVVMASGTQSDADEAGDACALDPRCHDAHPLAQEYFDLNDKAATQRGIGIAGFVVGGVGVATGVTLLLLSASKRDAARAPAVLPYVGYRSAGVLGRF
jgi:hypothetical protein